ncbi:hypothetical protein TVAG_027270 [Trichomonas vaginalis G3]|uniref:Uncharacterized protein n=1 Tax=Trichomonas vaginalis (strain ATCC PRA-98 / G3) TaxID=412133 RepID=A2F1H2_TRIV3|nr:CNH domain containing family [Trichomonas vaginalis G3]EAY01259.1 hypothetical protein TVAG_027270 [Trichomonas vaginalis G3]KAI5487000.1 CNH domain containing family [Trichomonas vaginalis G3]|eukprot:XP_001314074.1 hypothetical protein [Trichomonas vaginalis G3]
MNSQLSNDYAYLEELRKDGKWSDIIDYVQKSQEFFVNGKKIFEPVYTSFGIDAVHMFFSPNVISGTVFDVLKFIDTCHFVTKQDIDKMEISFLEFCIFQRNMQDNEVHHRLISSYLSALETIIEKTENRTESISIENEKNENIKNIRRNLLSFLKNSQSYHPATFSHRVPPYLVEERLVIFARSKNYDTCVEIMSESKDEKIVFTFCDYILNENDDIYTNLAVKISGNPQKNELFKKILNTRYQYINPDAVIDLIPPNTKLVEYKDFFEGITVKRREEIAKEKLSLAIMGSTLDTELKNYDKSRTSKITLFSAPICSVCFQPIESDFVLRKDKTIVHSTCNKNVV